MKLSVVHAVFNSIKILREVQIKSNPLVGCLNDKRDILGVDYSTLQQSIPVSGSGTTGTVNVGALQACGTSSAQFIEVLIDGTPVSFAAPPDDFNYSDTTTSGAFTNKTWISAFRQNAGSFTNAQISFNNNAVVANGLPINSLNVNGGCRLHLAANYYVKSDC